MAEFYPNVRMWSAISGVLRRDKNSIFADWAYSILKCLWALVGSFSRLRWRAGFPKCLNINSREAFPVSGHCKEVKPF